MKRIWLKRVIFTAFVGLVISPCVLCGWVGWGPDIVMELSLRVYPGARRVADAYGYYGASSGQKALYYWASDSIEAVQSYYEAFTFPFIADRWNSLRLTVFSADGSELVSFNVDGSQRNVDYAREPRCHYTQV
jgi:hypothetical protein